MTPKTIVIDTTESLVMDAAGHWMLIDTDCQLREPITEREAIDVLERRTKRNPSLKPLLTTHFPMHNFYDEPPVDQTPSHKADAY